MAAAPNKGRRSPGTQSKPGRALAVILLVAVALIGGMFLSGHTTPRLGIDLAGGTSITLSVDESKSEKSAINQTNLATAVSIIERRVNGLGVSEAEVQTQGDRNIIVNIPKGTDERQAREQVGTTAQLYFRPVIAMAAAEANPEPSASPSGKPSGEEKPDEDADASPSPEASGSPENSASPQGALTDGLTADDTASPSASSSPDDTASPKADPSDKPAPQDPADEPPAEEEDPASAALQKKLDKLDCTDPKQRAEVNKQVDAKDSVVACGPVEDDPANMVKYALGPAAVEGTDVDSAQAAFDGQRGQGWIVQMEFDDQGTSKFANITEKLSVQQPPQNQFAIVLDGEVVSAPSVSERLGGGSAEISGSFNQQSADELANVLKFGALPLAFEESSVTTVSPMLGGQQLEAGLIAGAIGLALVVAYLLLYYRGLSLIAIVSLLFSALLTYSIMALLGPTIGFALNLPAVCGAIVAIGITADSFIVYFERIRDEIREGRTLRPAVERAWPRARRTILVSDFVSFLAAAVLFTVTVGKVQGFAFTLGLTTALDVVVVFLFTKPLMTILARKKFFASGHPWSGLDPKRLGAPSPLRRSRRSSAAPTDPQEA